MPETQAILEGHLDWVKQHYLNQLTSEVAPALDDRALRDGLMLLVDMRFTEPPRHLYEQITAAPTADLIRWAAMTFQVGGLVAVCEEILADG